MGCSAKDVEFSRTGPGLTVDLGHGNKAHKAAGFGREAHRFARVGRECPCGYSGTPGRAIGADIDLIASDGAVGATILRGK